MLPENATSYGLGASVWGADEDRAMSVALRIASGTVWLNQIGHHLPIEPFAGIKQSGFGTESGVEGLLEHTSARTVVRKTTPHGGMLYGTVSEAAAPHP